MQKIFSQELRFKPDLSKVEGDDGESNYPDWEEKKLGEIANFRRGSFPQPYGLKKWYDDENGFPFIQVYDVAGNLKLKKTTKRKISEEAKKLSVFVKRGTLILTIQGSIGRMAITEYDACIDRTLLIFQSYNLPINKTYFMYVVYLLFEFEKQRAVGGTIKTITKEKLSDFKVKIPSIEEQTKIANFLSAIDAKIQLVNTQLENTTAFKKGLLQQMFV
ncbi:restriction endonuclease subunit S [Tenacibaculum maritimum]